MTTYYWTGPDVLKNYGNGCVFVRAASIEEAREKVRSEIRDYFYWLVDGVDDDYLADKLAFLLREPEILPDNQAWCFIIHGSE